MHAMVLPARGAVLRLGERPEAVPGGGRSPRQGGRLRRLHLGAEIMTKSPGVSTCHQNEALAPLDKIVREGTANRIDTRASIVFLEPDRVLKVTRAVRLPFLDYSTLDKRTRAPNVETASEAGSYFDLALQLLKPVRPSLIAIGGKSGTGKSVLARDVAGLIPPLPGAVILRSDVIRKELFGVGPLASLPQTAYTPDVTARVYGAMPERSHEVITQGLSVIVDAAFLQEAERDELSAEARSMSVDDFRTNRHRAPA